MKKIAFLLVLAAMGFSAKETMVTEKAFADTTGVGSCYTEPNCIGPSIGIMPYDTCKSAGGGGSSWLNQDGSGCYN